MNASTSRITRHGIWTALLVVALVAALGALPAHGASGFSDIRGNTHEANIEALADRAVTLGCNPQGTLYCPSDSVTRGQMATFIVRALRERGVPIPANAPDAFDDDDGSTHEANINALAAMGVVQGGTDGTYRPGAPVTRAQMGSFLQRGFDLPTVDGNQFRDLSGTHQVAINTIAAAGITLGCSADGTRYCPADDVRRDQMASFLIRALRLPVSPGSTPETTVPDLSGLPAPTTEATATTSYESEREPEVSAAVGGSCGLVGSAVGDRIVFDDRGITPLWGWSAQHIHVRHWVYYVPTGSYLEQGRWRLAGRNSTMVYAPNPYHTMTTSNLGGGTYGIGRGWSAAFTAVYAHDGTRWHEHPVSRFHRFGPLAGYWCWYP